MRTIGIEKPLWKYKWNIPVDYVKEHALQLKENNIKLCLSSGIFNFIQLLKESFLTMHKENTLLGG